MHPHFPYPAQCVQAVLAILYLSAHRIDELLQVLILARQRLQGMPVDGCQFAAPARILLCHGNGGWLLLLRLPDLVAEQGGMDVAELLHLPERLPFAQQFLLGLHYLRGTDAAEGYGKVVTYLLQRFARIQPPEVALQEFRPLRPGLCRFRGGRALLSAGNVGGNVRHLKAGGPESPDDAVQRNLAQSGSLGNGHQFADRTEDALFAYLAEALSRHYAGRLGVLAYELVDALLKIYYLCHIHPVCK